MPRAGRVPIIMDYEDVLGERLSSWLEKKKQSIFKI